MAFVDIFNTDRKYNIIYADPPWKYGSKGCRSGQYGKLDYNNMTTGDIAGLPVKQLRTENCILLMWFTGSFVEDAIQVCRAWGFKPVRIDTVWNKKTSTGKPHGVPGPWGMSDCEFTLLGTRGKAASLQVGKRNMYTGQDVEYPGVHSRKPWHFHELIESRFQPLPKIELFARQHRPGWDCWGNEVE